MDEVVQWIKSKMWNDDNLEASCFEYLSKKLAEEMVERKPKDADEAMLMIKKYNSTWKSLAADKFEETGSQIIHFNYFENKIYPLLINN